jgi:zinc protease
MFKTARFIALLAVVLLGLALQAFAMPQTYESTLPNGLRIIMIPDSRAQMAASYVVVNAAVRYETPDINGATHLLEHMLFNGTETLTQDQLYAETDRLGAFNNAFTRKDYTAFMIMAPSRTFAGAFALQADMLLHSTLPSEKLEKERGIVTEEINQGMGSPDEAVTDAWQRILWAGTPYEMTTLGPKSVIAAVSRDKVLAYYKSHYSPNQMTILLIGDFEPIKMLEQINSLYGDSVPQAAPKADFAFSPAKPGTMVQYFNGISPSINFAVKLLELKPDAEVALGIGEQLLSERLSKAFKEKTGHDVEVMVDEDAYIEGGYLVGSFAAQDETEAKTLARLLPTALDAAIGQPDEAWLARAKREMLAGELKEYDNFLYFGMSKSALIAQGKWDMARSLPEIITNVTASAVAAELSRLQMVKNVTILMALPYPEAASGKKLEATTKRVVLANGVTLLVKSDPRSEVFGMTVLFRNRSFAEPAGRCGIAELWQRTLQQGPAGMTADEFAAKQANLGMTIDFVDNPYIPMDDMYLSPRYSWIKAEGLDESWRDNIKLIADTVVTPKLDDAALGQAKRSLMQVLGMKGMGTRDNAATMMLSTILGDTPLAKPVEGIAKDAGIATLDDLKAFAAKYSAGGNIIVSIATSTPLEEAVRAATEDFSGIHSGPAVEAPAPTIAPAVEKITGEGSPQATIYYGYSFNGLKPADRAALTVLGGIIGDRSAFVIREEKGLAYSVGAGFSNFGEIGWFSLMMGTGPENIDVSKETIKTVLTGLTTAALTAEEVERGVNSMLGRRIMRRITRKNQAFYAASSELLGEDDSAFDLALQKVKLADVERVRSEYFHPDQGAFFIVK